MCYSSQHFFASIPYSHALPFPNVLLHHPSSSLNVRYLSLETLLLASINSSQPSPAQLLHRSMEAENSNNVPSLVEIQAAFGQSSMQWSASATPSKLSELFGNDLPSSNIRIDQCIFRFGSIASFESVL